MKRGIKAEECPAVLVHPPWSVYMGKGPFKSGGKCIYLKRTNGFTNRRIAAMSENSNIGIGAIIFLISIIKENTVNAYYGQGINERERRRAVSLRKHNKTYDSCQ